MFQHFINQILNTNSKSLSETAAQNKDEIINLKDEEISQLKKEKKDLQSKLVEKDHQIQLLQQEISKFKQNQT